MHRDGERSRVVLSGMRELPWCQVEHLFQASGWTGKNVLLDSLLMPGGLWPLDSKGNLDTACSLLRCKVLNLVLYMKLQAQERRAGQTYCVILLIWRESEKKVWSFIWVQMISSWFLSPHSYPLTMLQQRITEYRAIDQLTSVCSNQYCLAMKQLSFIFSYLWGNKDKVCDCPSDNGWYILNTTLIS
jgi:hypothetical protein